MSAQPAELDDPSPSEAELSALMADDTAWASATAKKGKVVGSLAALDGKGKKRMLAMPSVAGPMTAKAAATAGLTRITITFNGYVNGRPEWELADEVRYADDALGCTLIAPKGYKFDLASVPRPL